MTLRKPTPMLEQYLAAKEKYQDCILFFRMGDFYEMFFEDAEKASKILEIALTSRNKNDQAPIPMCGVPVRAVQGYLARLITKGHKVAICEQVEDPSQAKGLVRREVVRVITPGMIVDNAFLDEKHNNYIVCVAQRPQATGIAVLDISTGTFRVSESDTVDEIVDEILRINPSEIILPESLNPDKAEDPFYLHLAKHFKDRPFTFVDDRAFIHGEGRRLLLAQFKTRSLEGFGCEDLKAATQAAGALLQYVRETQKQVVGHLTTLETYSLSNYLIIDEISRRNLEIFRNISSGTRRGTLIDAMDQTVTAMGSRLLTRWLQYPLLCIEEISRRQVAVEEARKSARTRRAIRESLKSVYDLKRLHSRISMGQANARDLLALKQSFLTLPKIWSHLSQLSSQLFQYEPSSPDGEHAQAPPPELMNLADLIEKAIREDAPPVINEGGIIKPGYDAELDTLIQISRDGKGYLTRLEAEEKAATGINSLKVRYNKVFGYYIEVPKSQTSAVPSHYVRKQTLVNAERYITDDLKTFESKVLNAEEKRAGLESRIFNDIRGNVMDQNASIQAMAQFLARVDCLLNFGEIAERNRYTRPALNTQGRIHIEDGRHPVIENLITAERFVPNSITLDNHEQQILIITGPNMAGKSTCLRQVALMILLAQIGAFVPAQKAEIGICDRIFTRVGALDNLSQGQSTFMVEMEETANILNNAGPDSLVIMDEIGRGTSTFDGLSLAWAVAEYLHDLHRKGVKTLFATHYHELTALAESKPRVKNFNIAVKEWNDTIIFLRKLVPGGTNRSYGIQVARLAGIPHRVIQRAREILEHIEKTETSSSGLSRIAEKEGRPVKKRHRQLSLFQSPEVALVQKLQKIDINRMTPLEALNCLNDLKQKVDQITI